MIKDTITYKNQTILTLYHKDFPDEQLTVKRRIKEYIKKHLIIFTEEYVPDEEWDNLTGYAWEEQGLLIPKEKYNPYYERACANMTHRIYPDKPSVICQRNGKMIGEDELVEVLSFIKKYTGIDIEAHPVFLGDVFLFSPSEFQYHSNKDNSIIFHELKAGMKVIVRLKNQHNILQSKIVDITSDTEKLEIKAECNWDNHDVEIYKDNALIYLNRDISYMRCVHLSFSMAGRKKRIPLTILQEYYDLEQKEKPSTSVVGIPPEPAQEALDEINGTLVHKINNAKASDKFIFIRPGERNVAMKRIADIIFQAKDELWLIDSYFTDKGSGLHQMTDWLRLIVNSAAASKNIVFYCNNESKALNATQLDNYMKADPVIQDAMAAPQNSELHLIQTKTAIHDRFLIIRNGDEYMGLAIGTSFNSLNSNHYCIHTLAHKEAREVIQTLYDWLRTNIAVQEDCKHDKR